MPSPLPLADPAPEDGLLPASAAIGADLRNFGVYLHVPFCRVRCGYCDFNTYTATELRGLRQNDYAGHAVAEVALAQHVLQQSGIVSREISTVFFGGGTPTLLAASDLIGMLDAVRNTWGLKPGAEITTEANPDSVDAAYLRQLAAAGFTRVSFGMQSAVPHVLATLERTHDPAKVPQVVRWARDAGLQVSVDLIYGTPGESLADWQVSLDAALACEPDHLSAYALIVEAGTKLARQIRRGEVAQPSDDLQADMYEMASEMLEAAGFDWYEVSNWARTVPEPSLPVPDDASASGGRAAGSEGQTRAPATSVDRRSRHNLAYWQGHDWWGIGPGAHSHVGGVRWWNVKHPSAYADRLRAGVSPAVGRETLDSATREVERIMLLTRIREGLSVSSLSAPARTEVAALIAEELVDAAAAIRGTLVLTLRGRLLADHVVRRLIAD